MKFKSFINAVIAIMLLAFTSCKKETINSPTPPVSTESKKLAKLTDGFTTYLYEYNADRTIKSYSWGNGVLKMVFEYQPNKLINTLYEGSVRKGLIIYTLINGIAQKVNGEYYDAAGIVTESNETIYTYNAQGKISKASYVKNGTGNGVDQYTYNANGNLLKSEAIDKNGIMYSQTEYEYDLTLVDKSGPVGQFFGSANGSVFPKYAKNLVKKQTITSAAGTTVYNITRTMDAAGYELTVTYTNSGNGSASTTVYDWQ
jgi:hypothetical protein